MRSSAVLPLLASAAAAFACAGTARAQASACALTDDACLEQEYPQVCFDTERGLRLEPCLAWLREIERSPSRDVRSSAAAIYLLIGPSAAPELEAELRTRSAELIDGILEEEPRHADALLGLANLATTKEERVRRLRDVVNVAPSPLVLQSLAEAAYDGTHGSALEAAALYERAYEMALRHGPGDYAWRFARNALWSYERADSAERAERLRARVASDYGLPAMRSAAANPAATDRKSLDRILQDLCREMTVRLFGPEPCLESVDDLVAAADRARAAGDSARLDETMSAAMIAAARSGIWLDAVDATWRSRFEAALARHGDAAALDRFRQTESLITVE